MGSAASVGQLPDPCTKEDCQALYGDLFNDTAWQKYAVNGSISSEALAKAFAGLTDAFLTHDWGTDGSTHKKVSTINKLLQARGMTTWFDEEKMEGSVKKQMVRGIDNARVIVVFVTQRYIDKVGGDNAEDNCQLEFNYAARRKTASRMIPVLIDPSPSLKNPATWSGEVGFVLGGHLYLDMTTAFDDEQLMAARVDELVAKIIAIAGTPIAHRFGMTRRESGSTRPMAIGVVASPRPALALGTLTKEEVATLLNNLACSKYSASFLADEITGEVLCGVVSADDVVAMGVSLAPKARMLFERINDFKANGVPHSLVASPSGGGATQDVPSTATGPDFVTFDQLKFSLKPSSWVQLYDYPLQVNGKNRLSNHVLEWPEPECSLDVAAGSGLFLNGNFGAKAQKNSLRLDHLARRLDKKEFLLSLRVMIVAGGGLLVCGGSNEWISVVVTEPLTLEIRLNTGAVVFVVNQHGKAVALPTNAWLDIVIRFSLSAHSIQVGIGSELMDLIKLPDDFQPIKVGNPAESNEFHLMGGTNATLFHGHLRNIELYTTSPASRSRPTIPAASPTVLDSHKSILATFVDGLTLVMDFPDFTKGVKDVVNGRDALVMPQSSYVHPEYGVYLDGAFQSEMDAINPKTGCVATVDQLNQRKFAVALAFAPLGKGVVFLMGAWLAIEINHDYKFVVYVTSSTAKATFIAQMNGSPYDLPLRKKFEWLLVAIQVVDTKIQVVLNDTCMDVIDLGAKFKFASDGGNAVSFVNAANGHSSHAFVKRLSIWSSAK
ncbi:Aste57867_18338 [Aphanomyces stellatus]|uniref:Aste57867_18338 protein n=1 Tax=Aphanomyces stellatus TaxID=120398 RepID=A0A485LB98_9STRA|nr:hypothetical protein As57867_018276 [Aphanomyces stellatus]VFT95074.1 Aste57867_18338 [Aphanomyces stellatus]